MATHCDHDVITQYLGLLQSMLLLLSSGLRLFPQLMKRLFPSFAVLHDNQS